MCYMLTYVSVLLASETCKTAYIAFTAITYYSYYSYYILPPGAFEDGARRESDGQLCRWYCY